MNKDDAVKINALVENIFALANQILDVANREGNEASRHAIQRAVALTVSELDLEVLETIYAEFPELRPPETGKSAYGQQ